MKHLQTFETIKYPMLKTFIVWKGSDKIDYEILKILDESEGKDESRIYVKHLYNVTDGKFSRVNKNALSKTTALMKKGLEKYIETHLVYQSDKLTDCKKFIEILTASNKYNI